LEVLSSKTSRDIFPSYMEALLNSLDLAKFAQKFKDEDVDIDAAKKLSEDDMKELGLTLGARKKLYAALHPQDKASAVAPAAAATVGASAAPTVNAVAAPADKPITGVWKKVLSFSLCLNQAFTAVQSKVPVI
jgi:hypothetical protein